MRCTCSNDTPLTKLKASRYLSTQLSSLPFSRSLSCPTECTSTALVKHILTMLFIFSEYCILSTLLNNSDITMESYKIGDFVDVNFENEFHLALVTEVSSEEASLVIEKQGRQVKLKSSLNKLFKPRAHSKGKIGINHTLMKLFLDDKVISEAKTSFISDINLLCNGNGAGSLIDSIYSKYRIVFPLNIEYLLGKIKKQIVTFEDSISKLRDGLKIVLHYSQAFKKERKPSVLLTFLLSVAFEMVDTALAIAKAALEKWDLNQEIETICKEVMRIDLTGVSMSIVESDSLIYLKSLPLQLTYLEGSKLKISLKYRAEEEFLRFVRANFELFNASKEKNVVFKVVGLNEEYVSKLNKKPRNKAKSKVEKEKLNCNVEVEKLDLNQKFISDEFSILNCLESLIYGQKEEKAVQLIKWRKEILSVAERCGWLVAKVLFEKTKKTLEVKPNDIVEANFEAMESIQNEEVVQDSEKLFEEYEERLKAYLYKAS